MHTTTGGMAEILSMKHYPFLVGTDLRLELHLFSEAAGLAFVNGAGQWDIRQSLLGAGGHVP